MSRETTYAGVLGDLGRLNDALIANAADLAHLAGVQEKVATLLQAAQEAAQAQAALIASKQEASRQLLRLIGDLQRVGTATRKLLREHYGLRAEKLAEFGVQPFRGRKRRSAPEIPAPEAAPPADSVSSES